MDEPATAGKILIYFPNESNNGRVPFLLKVVNFIFEQRAYRTELENNNIPSKHSACIVRNWGKKKILIVRQENDNGGLTRNGQSSFIWTGSSLCVLTIKVI